MFLSDLSIKRPIMMSMGLVALLLFGAIGYFNLPLNLLPEIEIPIVTVTTVFPGAGPDQVETQITTLIEDEVGTISQIDNIQSFSLDSAAVVIIQFELTKDADVATQEVRDRVALIVNELPEEADEAVVEKIDITATPIVNIVMSGDLDPVVLSELADTTVSDQLSRIAGVGTVSIAGRREREIRVEFDNRVVYENEISLVQVAQVLSAANVATPGGNIQAQEMDFSVRMEGEFAAVDELAAIDIPTAVGLRRLGSIATVYDGGADVRERVSFFDTVEDERDAQSLLISVIKSPDGNTVDVADAVIDALPRIQASLRANVGLRVVSDDSTEVRGAVEDTLTNIGLGIALTALVLLLFLRDIRSTLIVALTMPMSIIPTFLAMDVLGLSLNVMSLMGISTAVGVLVMNSVIVIENIFRHTALGADRVTAASRGTSEMVIAVIASTATNIAVFLPLAGVSGVAGLYLYEFALAITFATLFSLLISFTLTPMLASKLLPESTATKKSGGGRSGAVFVALERGYKGLLEKLLVKRWRSAALVAGVFVAFVAAMSRFGGIPFELLPIQDHSRIVAEVELAQGTDLDVTAETLAEIERRIATHDEVVTITTTLGSTSETNVGTNVAVADIRLVDRELRDRDNIVAGRIAADLATVPGALIKVGARQSGALDAGAPVLFYLQGEDTETLASLARELRPRLQQIPGMINVDISAKAGRPEVILIPDRIKINDAGLTVQDIAISMRAAVEGMVMTTLREGGEEYDIRVTLNDEDVSGYDDITNIVIPTRAGLLPLGHFAEVSVAQGINQILREDRWESVQITADLEPGYVLGEVSAPIEETVAAMGLPPGYQFSWGGDAESFSETAPQLLFAFALAIILTYMLLAAILEKTRQPLLILSTVPLSLIGVVAAFYMTGLSMNIISILSIIMLVGMVVNNAILILDYANQLRTEGRSLREALIEAAPTKLKPILMANTATILGMLPMALGIGASGVEFRQPMGVVSIGGLITATFLSLFVIPALEIVVESRTSRRAGGATASGT